MSSQAEVHSIEALKDLRVAMALFADDVLGALGGVDMEVRRTVQWLQHDRKAYWQEQIKRRREQVSSAQAEVFRRKLAKTADYTPAYSEQKELLRRAEASLRDAEMRAEFVKKWEPALQQAVLEYHASTRRIKDLAAGDVPRALAVLERMVDALEAYLRVASPGGPAMTSPLESIAGAILGDDPAAATPSPAPAEPEVPEPPT
jgi:hypothetical protein